MRSKEAASFQFRNGEEHMKAKTSLKAGPYGPPGVR